MVFKWLVAGVAVVAWGSVRVSGLAEPGAVHPEVPSTGYLCCDVHWRPLHFRPVLHRLLPLHRCFCFGLLYRSTGPGEWRVCLCQARTWRSLAIGSVCVCVCVCVFVYVCVWDMGIIWVLYMIGHQPSKGEQNFWGRKTNNWVKICCFSVGFFFSMVCMHSQTGTFMEMVQLTTNLPRCHLSHS